MIPIECLLNAYLTQLSYRDTITASGAGHPLFRGYLGKLPLSHFSRDIDAHAKSSYQLDKQLSWDNEKLQATQLREGTDNNPEKTPKQRKDLEYEF